jgi:predicted PilT family ATPase
MKKIELLIIFMGLILIDSFAFSQGLGDFKPGSKPDGFRGIKWRTEISTLKDMVFVMAIDEDVKRYKRRGDELKIGKAKLDYIQYEFRKGRFYLVEIGFQGVENLKNLKEAMSEIYGKGRSVSEKTEKLSESYFWKGEKTDIMVIYDADIGGGITISSK